MANAYNYLPPCTLWSHARNPAKVAETLKFDVRREKIVNCCKKPEADYHAPDFVRAKHVSCDLYRTWLKSRVKDACRRGKVKKAKKHLHQAVLRQGHVDFYTGEDIEWGLLKHKQSVALGRKGRTSRGRLPSADHYDGTNKADFRICSAATNWAKGSLSHDQFVALCIAVTIHSVKKWRKITDVSTS